MREAMLKGLRSPAAWLVAGILAALLLACAGPVHAQQRPAKEPAGRDFGRHLEQQMKEAEDHDPSSRRFVRAFKWWFVLVVAAMVVVGAAVVLKMGGWLYFRAAGTTDPEKLARSDPWVREHLRHKQAAESDPPADGPPKRD